MGATSLTDPKVQSTKRGSVSIMLPSAISSSSSLTNVALSKPGQEEPNEDLGEDDVSRNDKVSLRGGRKMMVFKRIDAHLGDISSSCPRSLTFKNLY